MELTHAQKVMKYTALAYAVMFIIAGGIFLIFPERLISAINITSSRVSPALPPAVEGGRFWVSLTVSMMATITALSLMIYRDVTTYAAMAVPLAVAKFTSSLCGLGFFVCGMITPATGWNTLANLVICLTDLPLGILMLALYRMVRRDKAYSVSQAAGG